MRRKECTANHQLFIILLLSLPKGMPISEKQQTSRSENLMSYMSKIPSCTEPFLAVWLYHVPTKQLLIEHDFNTCMSKEQLAKAHLLIRMMMKPNMFYSAAFEKMPTGPKVRFPKYDLYTYYT